MVYRKNKRKKSWRYLVGYWSPFIIGVIVLGMILIGRAIVNNNDKEIVQESRPFGYTYVMTPMPSNEIPSELLEYMAIQAEGVESDD